MSDLIDTTEMYLRTIYELEEEGIVPLRARIAERLGHSGPTVSQTVARMERDGLLHVSGDRHLELTDDGRAKAVRVMRKHRLAERLLTDVIGLEWEYVHEEACRWEHVMSERVERKLLSMLPGPLESPYGNPIPGLEELGGPASSALEFRTGVRNLVEALADGAGQVSDLAVRRLGEPVQTEPEVLSAFVRAGLRPGVRISAVLEGALVRIEVVGEATPGAVEVTRGVAAHVFVSAPAPADVAAELPVDVEVDVAADGARVRRQRA